MRRAAAIEQNRILQPSLGQGGYVNRWVDFTAEQPPIVDLRGGGDPLSYPGSIVQTTGDNLASFSADGLVLDGTNVLATAVGQTLILPWLVAAIACSATMARIRVMAKWHAASYGTANSAAFYTVGFVELSTGRFVVGGHIASTVPTFFARVFSTTPGSGGGGSTPAGTSGGIMCTVDGGTATTLRIEGEGRGIAGTEGVASLTVSEITSFVAACIRTGYNSGGPQGGTLAALCIDTIDNEQP